MQTKKPKRDRLGNEAHGGLVSHPPRHQYRFSVVSTWVQFKQGVEHLQDGVFMHELLHVTMSYCLDIAGIVAYRTALAVLLLLSDGILWIGKHHTNRQVSYHTPPHWMIPTFHWFLTSSVGNYRISTSSEGSSSHSVQFCADLVPTRAVFFVRKFYQIIVIHL